MIGKAEGKKHIDKMMHIIKQQLPEFQQAQKRWYDRPTEPRESQLRDKFLALVPTPTSKFLAYWQGPYTILEKIGLVNYRIDSWDEKKKTGISSKFIVEMDPNEVGKKYHLGLA